MKILLLLSLAFVVNAHAQRVIYPRVINFGNSVQVQVDNQNSQSVSCNGPVYMHMASGMTDVQYYFETIRPNGFSFRTLYPNRFNDRINYINDSIYCR